MLALPLPSALLFHDAVAAYAGNANGGWTAV